MAGKEKLHEQLQILKQQLEKAMQERNHVQLERNAIQTFYSITKKEVQDLEKRIWAKDREIEQMEEHHRVELRVYQQKVKHLEYEHENNLKLVDAESSSVLAQEGHGFQERSEQLQGTKVDLRHQLLETGNACSREVEQEAHKTAKKISKTNEGFEERLQQFRQRCESRLDCLRADLQLRGKVDIHEMEERKNLHINELMQNHEVAFRQMKDYYNRITRDNLELIRDLKNEVKEMKARAEQNQREMSVKAQENKGLKRPLENRLRRVRALQLQLKDRQKDGMSLRHARARSRKLQEEYARLEAEHEALLQRHQTVQDERDNLYETFEDAVNEVQQRGEVHNMALEQQLLHLDSGVAKANEHLGHIWNAGRLDPVLAKSRAEDVAKLFAMKSEDIAGLKYKVARATKAHNDFLRTVVAHMLRMGISEAEIDGMGISPMTTATSTIPAGLVVRAK